MTPKELLTELQTNKAFAADFVGALLPHVYVDVHTDTTEREDGCGGSYTEVDVQVYLFSREQA